MPADILGDSALDGFHDGGYAGLIGIKALALCDRQTAGVRSDSKANGHAQTIEIGGVADPRDPKLPEELKITRCLMRARVLRPGL